MELHQSHLLDCIRNLHAGILGVCGEEGSSLSSLPPDSLPKQVQHRGTPGGLLPCDGECLLWYLTGADHQTAIAPDFYMPLYFQSALGASPLRSGLLILPFVLSEAAGGISAGIFINRSGKYLLPMYLGCTLMTVGTGLFILLRPDTSLGQIIGFQMIYGLGGGWVFEPPMLAIQALVPQDDVATATSLLGFSSNFATSISVVIGGVLFQNGMNLQGAKLQDAGLPESLISRFTGDEAEANVLLIDTVKDSAQRLAIQEGYSASLRTLWIMYTAMGGCALLASLFVTKSVLSKVHVETKTGLKDARKTGEERST